MFGPVKTAWEQLLVQHGRTKIGKGPCHLQKGELSKLLKPVWMDIYSANIVKGFSSTGIYPFNKDKIPENWFREDQLTPYKQQTMRKMTATPAILAEPGHIVPSDAAASGDGGDWPLDLSMKKKPAEEVDRVTAVTVKDIVTVFREGIQQSLTATPSSSSSSKTRLSHHTYGEVLTSPQVWDRLQKADEKKAMKRPNVGGKRGRPKKIKPSEN